MDPYKTLGVAKNASTKEIKDSYRKLKRKENLTIHSKITLGILSI